MGLKGALIIFGTFLNLSSGLNKGCSLEVIIDPYFHANFVKGVTQRSEPHIKRQLGHLVQDYVDFTNKILKKYTFFKDGSFVQLYIKRIKIMEFPCSEVDSAYCQVSENLHDLLEAHSSHNHNDVCLSYVFTFQHLSDSTLGLAWTANPGKADEGGVCARFHQKDSQADWQSHNTGVVNFAYNLRELPQSVAQLAFAHEIGHSFGSPHDFPSKCVGDDISGNFLMHQSGVRGYLENNYKLSRCSYHNITFHFAALPKQDRNCLDPNVPQTVCGNGIVEAWEECDCGETSLDCKEECCYPADHRQSPCQLKSRKICSPSEGPCCTSQCEFATEEGECSQETQCRFATKCSGKKATCPIALHKSDTDTCDGGSRICRDGVCSSSICAKYNLIECTLKDASPCQVHCQVPNRPETCKPTEDLSALFAEPIYRPYGAPCDMIIEDTLALGSCSARYECVGGHPSLQSSSWAVGLGIFLICYIIFMIFAIWIYCRYCKSSNKPQTNQQLVLKPESNCD